MIKDLNKNITNIQYNLLSLPSVVTFGDGSMITYLYAADGTKLRTTHTIGGVTTTTDYCGNVLYENGTQKQLLTEEGYIDLSASTPTYYYYLKDHQGNNRVVVNSLGTVQETNHYYPFGGLFATNSSIQPYKYNGKEFDSKGSLNWYDYGARHYDAVLGRFMTGDRFSEKYFTMSQYQYGANNPVLNIDINGDSIVIAPNPNGIVDQIMMLFGCKTEFQMKVYNDLEQLKRDNSQVASVITYLENSTNIHEITMPPRGHGNISGFNQEMAEKGISQGSVIYYNPYASKVFNKTQEVRVPRIGLAHELQHSYDADRGIISFEKLTNGINLSEIRAINLENKVRNALNHKKRTMYGEKPIPPELLD